MKVIKKINNNVALCLDNNNQELIAFGKGIGFPAIPYVLDDLSKINRTFYCVREEYVAMFSEIDEELFSITAKIIDYARQNVKKDISDSLYFILIDHINFAIKRYREGVYIRMAMKYDMEYLYEDEMNVGRWAVDLINYHFGVRMLNDEAAIIAMHIVEYEETHKDEKELMIVEDTIIENISKMVEEDLNLKINKQSFNYSRFITHIKYLLRRTRKNEYISSDNAKMFKNMKEEFPKSYECAIHIQSYLKKYDNRDINEEEILYMMLHINRLCSREDCNQ